MNCIYGMPTLLLSRSNPFPSGRSLPSSTGLLHFCDDTYFLLLLPFPSFNQSIHQSINPSIHQSIHQPRLADGSSPVGAYVGFSPADRDASLLRAQLEPWSTTALRRRLVADFGRDPSDPEQSDRAAVVKELLECYAEEGLMLADGRSARRTVHVAGEAVPEADRSALLAELRRWAASVDNQHAGGRERPTVRARAYMILTSPAELQCGTAKALKAVAKLQAHAKLWELAVKALKRVDPDFADSFTALAVTSQFEGSPHIDKRNVGPFYGLALGDFANKTVKENDNDNEEEEGRGGGRVGKVGGGICVEATARVVAYVDTANKLGKIDGRYPHWVAPYDAENDERFSLIYYKTAGAFEPAGPAVFDDFAI